MRIRSVFLAAPLLILGFDPALATTTTTNLSVTATVSATCLVTASGGDVAFGLYDPTSGTANDAGVGTVTVTCTNGTTYSIALGDGSYYSTGRRMRSSTTTYEYLSYGLYQEAGRTTLWGDGTHGSVMSSLTGNGSAQAHGVYGRIPANQYVKPDSYLDTVVVTVTY